MLKEQSEGDTKELWPKLRVGISNSGSTTSVRTVYVHIKMV